MTSSPADKVGRITRTDAEWRDRLDAASYHVMRHNGTERPFTGEYTETTTAGVYRCKGCDTELFRSDTKFSSHCGWPSFYAPAAADNVRLLHDTAHGMDRTEVRCAVCDSHLGHVFHGEGYRTPTDDRYCINSVCLVLEPEG